jgi:hydrogenase/urease accessory protein HupE
MDASTRINHAEGPHSAHVGSLARSFATVVLGLESTCDGIARTCRGQLGKLASTAGIVAAVIVAATMRLAAHDPGLSSLDVQVGTSTIVATLSLAAGDARGIGKDDALSTLAPKSIQLILDGRRLMPTATSVWSDDGEAVHARMTYDKAFGGRLLVRSEIPQHLARGHRELLSIGSGDGRVRVEHMLDGDSNETTFDIAAVDSRSSFTRFLRLGVEHILTGYDHLLFLAGVLVVLRRWRDVVQTVTAFTLAHSMTLGLATTGLLLIPSHIVEPLIAASIVYVGAENLVRTAPASRWELTFAFGLVHGLGFATVLRDLGVGGGAHGGIALPLAAFNIGVEVGQIAVASCVVPLFWWLSGRSLSQVRLARAWSVLVIAAGTYWFVERIV